jgi:hypothetical protein
MNDFDRSLQQVQAADHIRRSATRWLGASVRWVTSCCHGTIAFAA